MSSPAGSVSEEALRLLAALEEQIRAGGTAGAQAASAGASAATGLLGMLASGFTDHVGGSAVCTLCPVCQGISLLRTTRPEVVEHLLAAALELFAALRSLVEAGAGTPQRPVTERITIS